MAHQLTTCTFCGVGCGIYLEAVGNQMVGAYPSMSHPTNQGRICLRGWHVHEVASSPDRLKSPLLKKDGRFQEVSWEEAIGFIASRMKEIRARHGPDALAFLNSPRCSNEEAYLLQKLARAVIGTNNVDHGTGVYCNNSINVLLDMLGVPATTNSISELARSEVIVVDGVDLARQLPTIGGAVIRAKLAGAKLVVIDSRRHRVAESADFFLQLKPGTEPLLYGAMAKVIVDRGLMNLPFIKAHCRGYEEFLARVRDYDLLAAADSCGVAGGPDRGGGARVCPRPLGGHPVFHRHRSPRRRAGGGHREPGPADRPTRQGRRRHLRPDRAQQPAGRLRHGRVARPAARLPEASPTTPRARRWRRLWGAKLPAKPGLASRSLLADRGQGQVRALWLCRYDPVSTAFFGDAANALQQCELVVAQHLFLTESARYAHVVLPTTAFGEERVTFTNTERRIQLAEQVIEPLPGTTPAWQQLTQVARALGADWKYDSAAEVMDEIGAVVPFYSGANYQNLAANTAGSGPAPRTARSARGLSSPRACRRGGFKFVPITRRLAAAAAPRTIPSRWSSATRSTTGTRTCSSSTARRLKREYRILLLDYPEGFVEMNPDDAKQLGIRDGEKIRLRAAGGSAVTAARVTPEVRSGAVFVPYFVRQVQQQIRGSTENGVQLIPVRVAKEAA